MGCVVSRRANASERDAEICSVRRCKGVVFISSESRNAEEDLNTMIYEYNFRQVKPITNIDINLDGLYFDYRGGEPHTNLSVAHDVVLHSSGSLWVAAPGSLMREAVIATNVPLIVIPSKHMNLIPRKLQDLVWITTTESASSCPWSDHVLDEMEDRKKEFTRMVDLINTSHLLPIEINPMSSVSRVLHKRIASDSLANVASISLGATMKRVKEARNKGDLSLSCLNSEFSDCINEDPNESSSGNVISLNDVMQIGANTGSHD